MDYDTFQTLISGSGDQPVSLTDPTYFDGGGGPSGGDTFIDGGGGGGGPGGGDATIGSDGGGMNNAGGDVIYIEDASGCPTGYHSDGAGTCYPDDSSGGWGMGDGYTYTDPNTGKSYNVGPSGTVQNSFNYCPDGYTFSMRNGQGVCTKDNIVLVGKDGSNPVSQQKPATGASGDLIAGIPNKYLLIGGAVILLMMSRK